MDNLQRITGKIFGETATATGDDPQIGQFGSALAGTYNGTTDVATIQNLAAWSNGFIDAVTPSTQFPPLPEMTGFGKVLSHQIAYILQKGLPEWDSGTTYYTGDYCKGVGNNKIYASKVDNNLNKAVTNTTYWEEILLTDSANKSLSNLNAVGEKHFLNKSQITNCALEIPHRVNYTCSGGVFTLKAGSVLIVPYGTTDQSSTITVGSTFLNANFKVVDTQYHAQGGGISPNANTFFVWVEVQNDITGTLTGSSAGTKRQVYVRMTHNVIAAGIPHSSASSAPSGSTYCYRSDLNEIDLYTNGTLHSQYYSLPICVAIDDGTNALSAIDCVYEGIYRMGGTIFADKGIKALSANGLKADGTINNGVVETTLLVLATTTSTGNLKTFLRLQAGTALTRIYAVNQTSYLGELSYEPTVTTGRFEYYFNTSQMIWYMHETSETVWKATALYYNFADTIGFGTDVYNNFNINKAFRAVDENKIRNARWVVDTYVNGTSWYRIWSDGWIEQSGKFTYTTLASGTKEITLLKNFSDTNYFVQMIVEGSNIQGFSSGIQSKTVSTFTTNCGYGTNTGVAGDLRADDTLSWYACGY